MHKKHYRIQPRVTQENFEIFQELAAQKGTDMSKLARQLIDDFISSELKPNSQNESPA